MNIEEELPISITLSPPPTTELNDESEMPLASARPSTPDKCAVCLNNKQMDIIARIDSCAHTFCFACILEWSKVRAICPLCKQAFKLITRERYSGEIVEEVRVQNPQSATSRRFSNLNEVLNWLNQHRRAGPHHDHEPGRRPHDLFRQMVYMEWLNTVQALVHRPTDNSRNGYLTPFVRGTNTINLTDLIPVDSIRRLLHRYLRQTTSELRQSTIYSQSTRQTVAFRKYIYLNRVFVYYPLIGHNQETLTVRECTPTWFAANPACLHRLVPFLARELLALLWNDERTIEHIIQEVLTTIQIHEIRSLVLTRKLSEYLGRYTKHFLHEFYTFASCPYDLAGFDRYAQYPNINASTQVTTPLQIELGDDDGDEETPIIIDETTDLAINTIDLASSGSSSSSSSSTTTTTTTSEVELISERRSSSPECEIVQYVQATRERSPTLIILSEDDDDDDDDDDEEEEQQESEVVTTTTTTTTTTVSRKRKHQRRQENRQSKRLTTSVSNQQFPESVVLDDDDDDDDVDQERMSDSTQQQQQQQSSPITFESDDDD